MIPATTTHYQLRLVEKHYLAGGDLLTTLINMQEWGIYVILEVVFLFPFTFWLLHRYASSHVRIAYKITVFVSW